MLSRSGNPDVATTYNTSSGGGAAAPTPSSEHHNVFDSEVPVDNANPNTPHNLQEAEQISEKVDAIISGAEAEAGLEDTTKTTPEPYTTEEEQEAEEEQMLMFIAIGLIVL